MAKEGSRARGPESSQRVHEFVNSFLGRDGIRMLRLLSWKLEDHEIISELIVKLYYSYLKLKEELELAQGEDALVNTETQQVVDFQHLVVLFPFGALPFHRSISVFEQNDSEEWVGDV